MMSTMRTYGQNCGLARSLDLIGERWTLLIVRELARGPKRFGDLTSSLQGIGTNLLAARLRSLQDAGIIVHEEMAPSGVPGYALTDRGRALVPMLESLALWGLEIPWPDTDDARSRAAWAAMTMRANMEHTGGAAPDGVYEFDVEGERFWLRVSAGRSELLDGPAPVASDVRVSCDRTQFMRLARGETPAGAVQGDSSRLQELMHSFRFPVDAANVGYMAAGGSDGPA